MNYRDLLEKLQKLTEEQLSQTVTIHLVTVDEFIPARALTFSTEENDILDEKHPLIIVE